MFNDNHDIGRSYISSFYIKAKYNYSGQKKFILLSK